MPTPEEIRCALPGFEFGAPCSVADLARAEEDLGTPLPALLREYYLAFNGVFRLPDRTPYLWPLFATRPDREGLVETNQLFRRENSFPDDLAVKCLFFGSPYDAPEYAWGFHRGLSAKVILTVPDPEKPFHILGDNPLEVWLAEIREIEARQQEAGERARQYRYFRHRFADRDMLIAREPNEAGYFGSSPYDGEPFDETRFRLVRRGWDHEHCFVCGAKVLQGDEWWPMEPPDEWGLCLECHARLFGEK